MAPAWRPWFQTMERPTPCTPPLSKRAVPTPRATRGTRVLLSDGEERERAVSALAPTAQLARVEVISVERIENSMLRQVYDAKLEEIASANHAPIEESERDWVFYSVDESMAKQIIDYGFTKSCKGGAPLPFGQGIYFAASAISAADPERASSCPASTIVAEPNAEGLRHVFLVRAAIGQYCVGSSGAPTPDARPDGRPYDSTVDDMSDPSMFVTYGNAQQFPEYLIRFKLQPAQVETLNGSDARHEREGAPCVLQ